MPVNKNYYWYSN